MKTQITQAPELSPNQIKLQERLKAILTECQESDNFNVTQALIEVKDLRKKVTRSCQDDRPLEGILREFWNFAIVVDVLIKHYGHNRCRVR